MSELFDYYQNCVHCGLCLQACPTYVERGDENDSPRGRIYLMQAIEEGRAAPSSTIDRHLALCLDCRGCETACPSGVQYGELIERYRTTHPHEPGDGVIDRIIDWTCQHILPNPRRTRWLLRIAAAAQATGLVDFVRNSGLFAGHTAALRIAEVVAALPRDNSTIPRHSQPSGPIRAITGLFVGCVSEAVFGHTNRATHRVLETNGCAVHCPHDQRCCGAIDYHAGRVDTARDMARANIAAFERSATVDVIITNVAGCGLMLKSYDALLADDPAYAERASAFSQAVRDVHEFLIELPVRQPRGKVPLRLTYHDACHLCHGQGIIAQPRELLRMIDGLELVPLGSSDMCCGAAGTYALTEPEMAGQIARRKLDSIAATEVRCVAIGNAGCLLHLKQHAAEHGRDVEFVHPIDLLDQAYAAE